MCKLAEGCEMLAQFRLSHFRLQVFFLGVQAHRPSDNAYIVDRQTAEGQPDQDRNEFAVDHASERNESGTERKSAVAVNSDPLQDCRHGFGRYYALIASAQNCIRSLNCQPQLMR